jgi:hypothetical protein
MTLIPATLEVEVERTKFKANPGKVRGKPYLKN